MRYIRQLFALLLVALTVAPTQVQAQTLHWNEQKTLHFSVLYPDGAQAQAQQYAQFVDAVYEEASAWWGVRAPTPLVVRIYPTMEAYVDANPLAAAIPGVVAHAHTGRREISVALPQTVDQTPDEVVNNVRHELTHIIAADLSGGKLTTMWQEGIAQNAEKPAPELDAKMRLMEQVIANNAVMRWADLDRPGAAYSNPRVSYPESYTIVAFLLGRNGVPTFKLFTEAMRRAPGYRQALEQTYKVSAEQLEREWLAQLPAFVAGGYRAVPVPTFDFGAARDQVNRGDYDAAALTLDGMLPAVQSANNPEALRTTNELLGRAKTGQQAVQYANEARAALSRGAYAEARTAAIAAQPLLAALGQTNQVATVADYARLAERGLAAQAQLSDAQTKLRTLRLGTATTTLQMAYTTFSELGDGARAGQAVAALAAIERGKQSAAIFLLICALAILLWNVWQRRVQRRTIMPYM